MDMTEDEFVARYAARSRITVEQLRELGLRPYPCHCGEDACRGWRMSRPEREDEPDRA